MSPVGKNTVHVCASLTFAANLASFLRSSRIWPIDMNLKQLKIWTLPRAMPRYTNPITVKQKRFRSERPLLAFARSLEGSVAMRTECYFKQAKVSRDSAGLQPVIV